MKKEEKELSINYCRYLKIENDLKDNPNSLYYIKEDILNYLGFNNDEYYIGTITDSSISIEHKYKNHILIYLFFTPDKNGEIYLNIRIDKRKEDQNKLEAIKSELNEFTYELKDMFLPFKELNIIEEESITLGKWNHIYRLFIDNGFRISSSNFIEVYLMQLYLREYLFIEIDKECAELIIKNKLIVIEYEILVFQDEYIKDILLTAEQDDMYEEMKEYISINYKV